MLYETLNTKMYLLLTLAYLVWAVAAYPRSRPFREALESRQASISDALQVDLGYGIYQGYSNSSTGINTWKG